MIRVESTSRQGVVKLRRLVLRMRMLAILPCEINQAVARLSIGMQTARTVLNELVRDGLLSKKAVAKRPGYAWRYDWAAGVDAAAETAHAQAAVQSASAPAIPVVAEKVRRANHDDASRARCPDCMSIQVKSDPHQAGKYKCNACYALMDAADLSYGPPLHAAVRRGSKPMGNGSGVIAPKAFRYGYRWNAALI